MMFGAGRRHFKEDKDEFADQSYTIVEFFQQTISSMTESIAKRIFCWDNDLRDSDRKAKITALPDLLVAALSTPLLS